MKSAEEDKKFDDPNIKRPYSDLSKSHKGIMDDCGTETIDLASDEEAKFNQDKLNNIKNESNSEHVLSPNLYDPDIAEICLGTLKGDKGKSDGSDYNDYSEISSLVESETQIVQENNNNGTSDKDRINHFENIINQEGNETTKGDSKKRLLSPNRNNIDGTESKRFRYDDGNIQVSSSNQSNTSHDDSTETATDNCLPIAVVAPLGFSEDLFIDPPSLKVKDEVNEAKHDIATLLDSFGDTDDKTLTLFDAEFDQIKSDILSSNSFKTLDGNYWTFDLPSSAFDSSLKNDSTKSDANPKQNQSDGIQNCLDINQQKKQFQRQPSVEHDILDFEKVLNTVMRKGSQNVKASLNDQESMHAKLQYTLPRSSVATSQCHQSPNQPCQHVSNSDLLRELLDQKTEITSAQAKRRQEIDLSFLQPDVVAGKGLSVSSDKILQTRTIDPRLTSIPYIERSRNCAHLATASSSVVSQSSSNVSLITSAAVTNTVVSSTSATMSERDPISLAEQRRASITLHHKVPPFDLADTSVTSSAQSNDESGSSNIIKDAFDFATEITDNSFDNVRSNNPSPRFDSRLHGIDGTSNPQPRTMYTNEQRFHQRSEFIPEAFRHNKTGPMFNRQMMGNRPTPDVNANGLLMKLEDTNAINFDPTHSMKLNSVDHVTSMPRSHIDFSSVLTHSKSQGFTNNANNMPLNGANGAYPSDGDIRGVQRNNSMPGHVDSQFRMDTIQSQSIMGEQSYNSSNMKFMPNSNNNLNTSDRSHLSDLMQRNQQKYTVPLSMGYPSNGMSQTSHSMSQQGQPMRGSMTSPGVLQITTEDPVQGHISDPGSVNRGGMEMMRPDTSLQIGMQERIRAMNVQQWYRRRMQTQMNRFPPQQQMMPRPGIRQVGFPGQDSVRPQAHAAVMNRPRQSAYTGIQRYGYPSGQIQGQNQYQNTVGQGQMSYQQYMDQRSQRINDMQMQNQMRMSRSFNVSPGDNTGNGMQQTPFPDSIPEFDIKPQSHVSQGSDMFPFNI